MTQFTHTNYNYGTINAEEWSTLPTDEGAWLLDGANWQPREHSADKVIAEGVRVGDTVDVVTLGAEVWVGKTVEHHQPNQEQDEYDGHCDGDEAALLGTIPLSNGDVGHKDEGCRETEEEPSNLGEVVNVGEGA